MNVADAGPVTAKERIAELDVLRGLALFGVLTMNFVGFGGGGSGGGVACTRIS